MEWRRRAFGNKVFLDCRGWSEYLSISELPLWMVGGDNIVDALAHVLNTLKLLACKQFTRRYYIGGTCSDGEGTNTPSLGTRLPSDHSRTTRDQ